MSGSLSSEAMSPAVARGSESSRAGGLRPSESRSAIAFVVGTYPILTTTFIDREISEVRRRDIDVRIFSLRRPRRELSPEQEDLARDVKYVLPVAPGLLVRSHLAMMFRHFGPYLTTLAFLLTRQHPSVSARWKTLMHFGEGIVVCWMLERDPCNHIHAHFLDRATTVALICSRLLGIPYSATAHANDIYVNPVMLREKIRNAKVVVTCTGYNGAHLSELVGQSGAVEVIHHGLDISRIQPRPHERVTDPRMILAVGQLKEKKGFRYLVEACRILRDQGKALRCVIVGEGPLREELSRQVESLGLSDMVEMTGIATHEEVLAWMRKASVFVLPAVIADDGDRDGIPNVILEAMATELPVVSTRHSGIPEAVSHEVSGLLVEPEDPLDLARAIGTILDDPERIRTLGARGREIVERDFALGRNVGEFLDRLGVS